MHCFVCNNRTGEEENLDEECSDEVDDDMYGKDGWHCTTTYHSPLTQSPKTTSLCIISILKLLKQECCLRLENKQRQKNIGEIEMQEFLPTPKVQEAIVSNLVNITASVLVKYLTPDSTFKKNVIYHIAHPLWRNGRKIGCGIFVHFKQNSLWIPLQQKPFHSTLFLDFSPHEMREPRSGEQELQSGEWQEWKNSGYLGLESHFHAHTSCQMCQINNYERDQWQVSNHVFISC